MRIRHILEYAFLRVLAAAVWALPHRAALAVGAAVAWLLHRAAGFRAAEARRRIRLVLGAETPAREVRRIAWVSFRNLAFSIIELLRLPRLNDRWIARHCDYRDFDPMRALLAEGHGALFATPHAGNWYLAGILSPRLGMPTFFLARPQKNPLTEAYLARIRGRTGVETLLNDTPILRGVIRRLREGKMLAILPDVRARTPAEPVRFFGGAANLGAGVAMFARHTGAPIAAYLVCREGWTRHRITLLGVVRPDPAQPKDADATRMMQDVMDHFDRAIRARPEQYFWYNKRWVLDPIEPPADPARAAGDAP